jgi:two-component sensor histidine kinase
MLCEIADMKRFGQTAESVLQGMRVQGLVMRELQHRMANTLTILQANCRVEFAGVADGSLQESLRKHEYHIHRLAELHHFLSRGAGHGEIEVASYFRPLCAVLGRALLAPLDLHFEAFIGDGILDGGTCEWLGLIVTELVTNAAKHGFPDGSGGCVRVELLALGENGWCCTVADNGCGMSKATRGTGSQILSALIELIDGHIGIETSAGGTSFTVLFPHSSPVLS